MINLTDMILTLQQFATMYDAELSIHIVSPDAVCIKVAHKKYKKCGLYTKKLIYSVNCDVLTEHVLSMIEDVKKAAADVGEYEMDWFKNKEV